MEFPLLIIFLTLTCIPEMILSGEWRYPYFNKGFLVYSVRIALESPNELLPEAEYLTRGLTRGFGKAEIEFKRHSDTEVLFRENLVYWNMSMTFSSFRGIVRLDRNSRTINIRGFMDWYLLFNTAALAIFFYYGTLFRIIVVLFVLGIFWQKYQLGRLKKELADFYQVGAYDQK